MPDIFVPLDTTGISPYFLAVRPQIYRFALKYTETNREKLQILTETSEMEKYLDKQRLLEQFTEFAAGAGIKKDPEGLKTSGPLIHTQLKAYIARNILDNKGFYPILDDIDNTLKIAVRHLGKDK
jgi:carboxyl-terminal processing protease